MTQPGPAQPGKALAVSGSTPASPRPAPRAPRRARSHCGGALRRRTAPARTWRRGFVKERVAAYKYPRVVWLAVELPMPDRQDPQARDQAARRGM